MGRSLTIDLPMSISLRPPKRVGMGQERPLRIAVVIPARFASSRLPGKPLADIGGRPLIQHVYERVRRLPAAARVLVATDDSRIASTVQAFGGEVVMTSSACATGTDRVAEAAHGLGVELVLNVQGDEPFIEAAPLLELVNAFVDDGVEMATLSRDAAPGDFENPNVVKVVCDARGDALYFSRSPIPFARNGSAAPVRAHVGVYAYRAPFLQRLASLAPTPLEKSEGLEQLRVLEHGWRIRVVPTSYTGFGVDTPEDLQRAKNRVAGEA
jgi:3-deoxy-manno-octulosonate cytidylyltransferase (CMP-KDO synthetase)